LRLRNTLTNTVTGSFNLLTDLTYLYATGNSTISGDFKNISSKLTYVYLTPCTVVDYTSGGSWVALNAASTLQIEPAVGYGLSSDEVDNIIIDVAATKVAGRVVTVKLQGSNAGRTAASDAARAVIIADGGTVTTN